MTQKNAAKTVAARPFNVNMSVDAPNAELHDYLRGYPGLFAKLSNGIKYLRQEQEKQGINFPIIAKPTLNRLNFRLMPELVEWAQQIGATAVNFQPVSLWTPETYNELWLKAEDYDDFAQVIERLIEMKQNGSPIMTGDEALHMFLSHFRQEKTSESFRPCRIGLRNFFIYPDGHVELCEEYPAIGNLKYQSAKEIWYGEKAKEIRQQTLNCDKLCLKTCVSQKTLMDKVLMGLKLLRN